MRIIHRVGLVVFLMLGSLVPATLADALTPAKLDHPFAPAAGMLDYADGLDALAKLDLKNADDHFSAAIAAQPKNSAFALALGMAHALSGDPAQIGQGTDEINQVLAGDPRNTAIKRLYVFALSRTGRTARLTDVYMFSTQDRFDRLLQASSGVPGGGNPFGTSSHGATEAQKLRSVARVFVLQQKQGLDMARTLFARGIASLQKHDWADAADDLEIVVDQYPDDATTDYYYAVALTGAGDYLRARQVASLGLRYAPTIVQAYCIRAAAAAAMGGINRAKADLALAHQLDPTDSTPSYAPAEKALAEAQAQLPPQSPPQLFQSLMNAARAGQSLEQLAPLAESLVRAASANRLLGDETYQDKLRALQWGVMSDPKNADKLASLGQFLCDEADVRGEWIDPDKIYSYYRISSAAVHDQELQQAQAEFKSALAVDGKNIAALVGLSEMAFAAGDNADAQAYAQDAMDVRPDDPQVLGLMSRAMALEAGNAYLASQAASTTITTVRQSPDSIWIQRQTPTAFGYARGAAMSHNADDLLAMAKQYTQQALHNLKDNPESYDYLGDYGFREQRYDIAIKAYTLAVKKEPDNIGFQYSLADAYAAKGDFAGYLGPCTIGRNLEQTSTGAQLLGAWQRMGGGNADIAKPLLDQATQLDAADSRIPAFLAAIAEGSGDSHEAVADWRAAVAIELAQLKFRGLLFGTPGSVQVFADVARLVGLRLRLANALAASDPAAAAALYQQNLAFESSMPAADMLEIFPAAMFPVVNQPWEKTRADQRRSPRGGEVMRANCGRAGMALDRTGQTAAAADCFRRAIHYAAYLVLAGAARDETYDALGWTTGIDPRTAAACLSQAGDTADAQTFTQLANRPGHGENPEPQPPTPGPHPRVRE